MLDKIKRKDFQVFIYHIKHLYFEEMENEIKKLHILKNGGKILEDGDVIHINTGEIETDMLSHTKFQRIMDINLELANELDKDKLFEMILTLTGTNFLSAIPREEFSICLFFVFTILKLTNIVTGKQIGRAHV